MPKLFIVEEALTTIDEALAMTSRDRDCYDDAALHRLRCELLLLKGATEAEDDEEAAAYMQAMIVFGETEQQITALQQLFAAAGITGIRLWKLNFFRKNGSSVSIGMGALIASPSIMPVWVSSNRHSHSSNLHSRRALVCSSGSKLNRLSLGCATIRNFLICYGALACHYEHAGCLTYFSRQYQQ